MTKPTDGVGRQAASPTARRADLHVHSTASELSRLGVQRALGLPECATPPEEVYELAKRRGMDFVTLTDHDTIDGAVTLAERYDDAFIGEELTSWFRGEPQAVHILVYGITPDDHGWLQEHARDVEQVAEYLHSNEICCALAHPFYAVGAPLQPRHRRRLAEMFPVWETRNGSRAAELNAPAVLYIDTHGGTGIGGTDDHAGVDIGRTFTEVPAAADWREYLRQIRAGNAAAGGAQGSAAKWAHAAVALALRTYGATDADGAADPVSVMTMIQRFMREADRREGETAADVLPQDARTLLGAWLRAVELPTDAERVLALLQHDDFDHRDLLRQARGAHDRRLSAAVQTIVDGARGRDADYGAFARGLFEACVPAIPYAPATAFLGREKRKVALLSSQASWEARPRVALVADAVGSIHGVTRTLQEIRSRGVPGYDVEVIGTDAEVDRRLSGVAEVDVPFYAGLKVGVPSIPGLVEVLAEGRYDLVHLVSPGPAGIAAAAVAQMLDLPIMGSYHTELAAYTRARTGDDRLVAGMQMTLSAFYGMAEHVLAPSPASDQALIELGVPAERVGRWVRGVDLARFGPQRREPDHRFGDESGRRIHVLYAGRVTTEKGADLLADAFLAAHARNADLHLVVAGGGPDEGLLRRRLGERVTFLGWQSGDELARTYANADLFLFPSATDTYGQVILEAQASGLAVIAVAAGGPLSLIEHGVSGWLCPNDASGLADAVVELAGKTLVRERLAIGGIASVRERTWDAALRQLSDGYGAARDAADRRGRRAA